MIEFRINEPYPLLKSNIPHANGAIMEASKEGSLVLTLFINKIMLREIDAIRKGKIEFRIYEDKFKGYLITLINIGSKKLTFEIVFDPSLYNDERLFIEKYLKSNTLQICAVDGVTLKAMRFITIPDKLYTAWLESWEKMLSPIHSNHEYMKWVEGMYRFSPKQLWEYSCSAGKVERQNIELEEEKMPSYVERSENYFDRIEKRANNIWKNVIKKDGIRLIRTPEEFYKEMQEEEEVVRVKSIIESRILCNPTLIDFFTPGLRNYFIINDIGYGSVCEKCGSTGVVVLLLDENYTNNLDKKVFLPSFESYYILGIQPEEFDFVRMFPVPINFETDYWYCPYCRELHKFSHGKGYLEYDQKVVTVDWNTDKAEHQKDEVIGLWNMFIKKVRETPDFGRMHNYGDEINPTPRQVEQARKTGLPVLLAEWMENCDDPNEDCSWDGVSKYVLPDGSIKIDRSHMY